MLILPAQAIADIWELKMIKKNILHSLIAYELHHGEVELVLKKLGILSRVFRCLLLKFKSCRLP